MADYYPLLARAISALSENTGESRRIVYERARSALLAQLRGADPPLPDTEVTRERLALEEAVRRVENEYAAMAAATLGSARPAVGAARPPVAPDMRPPEPDWELAEDEPPPEPERPAHGHVRPGLTPRGRAAEPHAAGPGTGQMPVLDPAGGDLRGERDRGGTGREVRDPVARDSAGRDAGREGAAREGAAREGAAREGAGRARPPRQAPVIHEEEVHGSRWGRVLMLFVVMGVIGAAAALGFTQRETIIAFIRDLRSGNGTVQTSEPPRPTAPELAKSTDRITQAPTDPGRRANQQSNTGPQASVAQRAVLFEENPGGGQQGLQQFVGNVVWKTESYSPGNGLPPDIAIRATVEIPDRQFKVDINFRRNQDASLPASHIIEVQFDLPANDDLGNVANIPGMRAKASEAAQGVPLAGLAVRVTPGYFLIGLSAQEMDRQRNLGLLITRNWLDLPMVFSNGRRGILVLEKGVPGEQAFREAYQAWGLPLPQEQPAQPAQPGAPPPQ